MVFAEPCSGDLDAAVGPACSSSLSAERVAYVTQSHGSRSRRPALECCGVGTGGPGRAAGSGHPTRRPRPGRLGRGRRPFDGTGRDAEPRANAAKSGVASSVPKSVRIVAVPQHATRVVDDTAVSGSLLRGSRSSPIATASAVAAHRHDLVSPGWARPRRRRRREGEAERAPAHRVVQRSRRGAVVPGEPVPGMHVGEHDCIWRQRGSVCRARRLGGPRRGAHLVPAS